MIELSGRLICADGAEAALVRELLPGHILATRAEAGCLEFRVEQTADAYVWSVFERFEDRAAFELHQARVRASRWGIETAAIKRDYAVRELG